MATYPPAIPRSDPPRPVSRNKGWRCSGGPTAESSREVGSDMFADDVADLCRPLGCKTGKHNDAVVRARRVDDQGCHAERLFERTASDVDVLDPYQRDDRIHVE